MEEDNAKNNPNTCVHGGESCKNPDKCNHMRYFRQQDSQSESTRLLYRGQNFQATRSDQDMFYDCLSIGDSDSQSFGKFDDPNVIRAALERANNATGILLKNFDKSNGWTRPCGVTLEITARLVTDQKQHHLTGKPVTVQMPLQFDTQSGQLSSSGTRNHQQQQPQLQQHQRQQQQQTGNQQLELCPCDSFGFPLPVPKPHTDYPALMYMKDERPYNPNTTNNAMNSRTQDIQTEKSYMRDHWKPQINRNDTEDRLSQTESSYIREHHTPNRSEENFGSELNAKISQTDNSFMQEQYIRNRDNIMEDVPSQTDVHNMDNFHYPTQFQSPPQEARKVCPCRSQPSIKKMQPTFSCHSDYPAESVKTVKSQPSVPTCCSSKVPNSVYKTPCGTISNLPSCNAKTDVNVCGIDGDQDTSAVLCGLQGNSDLQNCPHSADRTKSHLTTVSGMVDHNVPPYNQPSFGYEEQTSCTSHSRSIVGKITCLCDSRSTCRPQNRTNASASCVICDQKQSLSERTVNTQNKQPLQLNCNRSDCVCPPNSQKPSAHNHLSKQQLGKPIGKRVSLPIKNNNNKPDGDSFLDCESTSETSLTTRSVKSKGNSKNIEINQICSNLDAQKSLTKTQDSVPIVTSCYTSKEPSMKKSFQHSISCVCKILDQDKSEPIVTSCYTSKEPSVKTTVKTSASCVSSKLQEQESLPIVTSCYTSKDPSMRMAFQDSAINPNEPKPEPEPEGAYKCPMKASNPDHQCTDCCENVGVVMACAVTTHLSTCHLEEEHEQQEHNDSQCSSYRSVCASKENAEDLKPVTRKQRILIMIEQLSNAADCVCNENKRAEMIQQLFRELTLMLYQEPECAEAPPHDDSEPPMLTFEECCAMQLAGQEPIDVHQSKKEKKRLECFAQLDELLEKCFMRSQRRTKVIPVTEIGFEFDPDFMQKRGSCSTDLKAQETESELSQMGEEVVIDEHESDVFFGYCDCEEDIVPNLQEQMPNETESELRQQVECHVPEAEAEAEAEAETEAKAEAEAEAEAEECRLCDDSILSQPVAETDEGGLCEESLLSHPAAEADEFLCEESMDPSALNVPTNPCPSEPTCPPDPCKLIEQCGDSALIPNGPLSPQARELFELLLRQALQQCEDRDYQEECEESLAPCEAEPRPAPCSCCHCRALICENECKSVNKTLDSAMCDPVCEMKYFIDSIIVDLHAMDQVLGKKKAKPKKNNGTRDLDKPGRESFPVTITDVSSLGCAALYIRWEVEDCAGIAGYEIYVDGHLTNRFYSYRHEAGVVANVDVTKTHQIVLRAHAMGQDFPGEGCGNDNRAVTNPHPELLVGAQKPWSPSVYFYDPI